MKISTTDKITIIDIYYNKITVKKSTKFVFDNNKGFLFTA